MTDVDWFAYVAFADCRCVAAVHVDEPDHKREVAKFTADVIRRGFDLERMRGDKFRKLPWRCPLHPEGRWNKAAPAPKEAIQETVW